MKNRTPQTQFKKGAIPQEHVMPHSMENREADSPSKQRGRNSIARGFQAQARPGLSGMQGQPMKRQARGR